jgi:hypothetical protein
MREAEKALSSIDLQHQLINGAIPLRFRRAAERC